MAERHGFSLETPVRDLSKKAREVLLHGDDHGFPGAVPYLRKRVEALLRVGPVPGEEPLDNREGGGEAFEDLRPYLTEEPCRACHGARLRPESLAVRLAGRSVAEYVRLSIADARPLLAGLTFSERERPVADRLVQEIVTRLQFLESLGLGYLTLDRPTTTLSGGEAHRIRLATQIGARMQGILYVLDEPSVGLHQRDNERLIETLKGIRDHGNTVVVVEHDEETIRAADWIVDLGEGAGRLGGRLMYAGPPSSLNGSLTGRYMRGELRIPLPEARRVPRGQIRVLGARAHNLRLVYTSSFMALGPTKEAPRDEAQIHPGPPYRNDYERTKALADAVARDYAREGGDIVILYPGVVYGPGELTDGNIIAKMIADRMNNRLPGIVGPGRPALELLVR